MRLVLITALSLVAPALPVAAQETQGQIGSFKPIASFTVPGGGVAEIVSSTPDGNTLVYANSGDGKVGIVDLTDPATPTQTATIPVDGEPTSVSVVADGSVAIAVVNTSALNEEVAPVITPGLLYAIALPSGDIIGTREIANGPDSVVTTIMDERLYAVIAIENQPIVVDDAGNLTDEEEPGSEDDISGAGLVQIVALDPVVTDASLAMSTLTNVDFPVDLLAARGLLFPDDPQPEFIDIRDGKAAVTLQENNGVAIIDVATGTLERVFNLGVVSDRPADLTGDDRISLTQIYPTDVSDEPFAGSRLSDAIAWSVGGTWLYTADEGEQDFTGGRGWSIWSPTGEFVWDDGGQLERIAVAYGMYPEGRSEAKGIEVEGIEVGVYGKRQFVFVGSERGSFVAVYEMTNNGHPRFVQLLPTGIGPEGLLALPQRNLFVTSDEESGTISVFEGVQGRYRGNPDMPTIRSNRAGEAWSALSGLAADPKNSNVLYSVPDNALPSAIYRIHTGSDGEAILRVMAPVTRYGQQARYDLEGIAVDTSIVSRGGFWLANEGNAAFESDEYLPNMLIQVDRDGQVLQEITLPTEIDSPTGGLVRSNGFEGVTVSEDGRYLVAVIQRAYAEDASDVAYSRVARYDLETGSWEFFLYPLDSTETEDDWIGLSGIESLGDGRYAIIERDKQIGGLAAIKKITVVSLDGVEPFKGVIVEGGDLAGSVLEKQTAFDVLGVFTPFEKVEGIAIDASGDVWASLDNDGGELSTILANLGTIQPE